MVGVANLTALSRRKGQRVDLERLCSIGCTNSSAKSPKRDTMRLPNCFLLGNSPYGFWTETVSGARA